TLNSLWAATPPSFQQHHVDGGARQVRGGAGVQCVGIVPELAVERGDRVPTRRRAHAAGVHHGTGAPLHHDRRFRAELAGAAGAVVSARVVGGGARNGCCPGRSWARASGARSSPRPRFVLDGAQRAVASAAARIVAPSDRSPATARAGPIAAALARKSSYVVS